MIGAILLVGDELLGGVISDKNVATIARALGPRGVRFVRAETVGDDVAEIAAAAARLADQVDALVVTGGLGPTEDDMTRDAFARALGVELEIDAAIFADLEARIAARGVKFPDAARRQASFPRGTVRIPNPVGSAPGFAGTLGRARFWVLPGVPAEVRAMIDFLVADVPAAESGHEWERIVATAGLGEVNVAELLQAGGFRVPEGLRLGFLPSAGGVRLRLAAERTAPLAIFAAAEATIRRLLADDALTREDIGTALLDELRERGETIATAESCTGGLIGARITDAPGASAVYLGGVVAYADRVKIERLGVEEALVKRDGAVSETVVSAMAQGCRRAFGASWAVSVTGIAGPTGGTPEKPVGTVWIAVDGAGGTTAARFVFPGSREMIRERTVNKALEMAYRRVRAGGVRPGDPS
jgi:nicotinamide-nucleotide amidase